MPTLILAAFMVFLSMPAHASDIEVSNGWVRLLPAGVPAAGYFELRNKSKVPIRLVGASSLAFGTVMLHRSVEENGRSTMLHLDEIDVPAQGRITFKPGDYHLMLMQPTRALEPGGRIPVTLQLATGEKVTTQFELRGPSGK
jgi:copper(I)-binding protein